MYPQAFLRSAEALLEPLPDLLSTWHGRHDRPGSPGSIVSLTPWDNYVHRPIFTVP